jgi:hypothetical protein
VIKCDFIADDAQSDERAILIVMGQHVKRKSDLFLTKRIKNGLCIATANGV